MVNVFLTDNNIIYENPSISYQYLTSPYLLHMKHFMPYYTISLFFVEN